MENNVLLVCTAVATFLLLSLTKLSISYLLRKARTNISNRVCDSTPIRYQLLTEVVYAASLDLLVWGSGLVIAVTSLLTTDVVRHPLTPTEYSPLIQTAAAATIGHFLYRILFVLASSVDRCQWAGCDLIGYAIGIMTVLTAVLSKSLNLLVVIWLIYQMPFGLHSLLRVAEVASCRKTCVVISIFSIISSVLLMLATPISATVYCIQRTLDPKALHLWPSTVCWLSLTWMMMFAVYFLVMISMTLKRNLHISEEERWPLLVQQTFPNYHDNNLSFGGKTFGP